MYILLLITKCSNNILTINLIIGMFFEPISFQYFNVISVIFILWSFIVLWEVNVSWPWASISINSWCYGITNNNWWNQQITLLISYLTTQPLTWLHYHMVTTSQQAACQLHWPCTHTLYRFITHACEANRYIHMQKDGEVNSEIRCRKSLAIYIP